MFQFPPVDSPSVTRPPAQRPPPPAPLCPRCNGQLGHPQPNALLPPIEMASARVPSAASPIAAGAADDQLKAWRHLCGLDVLPVPEQEPEHEQDHGVDSDDGSDTYDDTKPYAALVNSPSPPHSPAASNKPVPKLTQEERAQRAERRAQWEATIAAESERERELRIALEQALGVIDNLTKTNAELASTHDDLEASLKIARSNLAMAEANAEMLEETLRRGDSSAFSGIAKRSPAPSGLGRGAVGPHAAHARGNSELSGRAVSVPTSQSKEPKGFGFWNRFMDGPTPGPSSAAVQEKPSHMRSPTQLPSQLTRSSSYSTLPSPTAPTSPNSIASIRAEHAKALAALSVELGELKRSKAALEDELETLSQALFEEANKMVADERRKLAEKEEEVREAREERDALRRTIKVLGGSAVTPQEEEFTPVSIPLPPQTPPSPPTDHPTPPLNPWATTTTDDQLPTLDIPPRDDQLPTLDRQPSSEEVLDGLMKDIEGEYGR